MLLSTFLEPINEQLFELSLSAEKYVNNDPNVSLIKLRQFGEYLAREIANRHELELESQETQLTLLKKLRNVLNIPPSIISIFHQIRIAGNKAVHERLGNINEARRVLDISYNLAVWYGRKYANHIDQFPELSRPVDKDTTENIPLKENSTYLTEINISRFSRVQIIYLDLEVFDDSIYRLGIKDGKIEIDTQDNIPLVISKLFDQRELLICGHNFRRFDSNYLEKYLQPQKRLSIIDTLELSIIAFPVEHSHKLNKEYKLSNYSNNNPLEDVKATCNLLNEIINTLKTKPKNLLNFYTFLLSYGTDQASEAYLQFFENDNLVKPSVNSLPNEAICGIDIKFLSQFIDQSSDKTFDQRLCVASIIAWNYESNCTNSSTPLGAWLSQFTDYQPILNQLKPVKFPLEFTYQPYLQEFGISEFRAKQEEAIQSILAAQNPLIIMATGGGKSLCFQLPALMLSIRQKGLTVVISPLQALMADQVKGLEEKGLDFATFINSNLRPQERCERLEQLRNGKKDLLYISAEQLRSPSIRALIQERLPSFIVFDEAHCISQWGHDFRPDYRYAPKFISELYQSRHRELPLMAFMTATATVAVRQDIKSLFADHQILIHTEICSSSKRENLEYRIIAIKQSKDQTLIAEVKRELTLGGAVLVFTATRKNTARLAQLLNENEVGARFYHGKISKQDKDEILQKFKDKEVNVVVATSAFGMGIDRTDVRAVIHHTMCSNLEGYVQESGRAGRDGKPANCTLLFDSQDAETAFFLQSLSQLSEPELRNLFIAVRQLRDQIYGKEKASEEYFWVTTNEIFQTSDLDEEFASDHEHRDTKIKVALHYLETFGMVERAENQSSFIEFELVNPTPTDSLKVFDLYAHRNNLPKYRKDEFQKLISAMHLAKSYCQNQDEPYPLEKLSDASGIAIKELKQHVKELQRAEVCTSKIPVIILLTKEVKGDTRKKYENYQKQEQQIIEELVNLIGDRQDIQINCRALATRLDPDQQLKLSSAMILEILEGWSYLKWIQYKKVRHDVVKITNFAVIEQFDNYQKFVSAIIEQFYRALGKERGARLRLSQDLATALSDINQITSPLIWELEDLEKALAWMHRHKIIRLADGSNLFYQSMKVRVTKGANKDKVTREYPKKVKPHYEEQARRIHIMLDYGEQHKQEDFDPQQYIAEYFSLPRSEFSRQHPYTDGEVAKRPVTQEDYDRIIAPLNPIQKEIVLSEAPAISVIAGPGSGKTRTIVHRIAYLVKVKRIDPVRIIALAYNRNAVRELRLRLQALVGEMASRLRVYTFHGLSLAILGRTVEPTINDSQNTKRNARDPNEKYAQLIKDACHFLEHNEEGLEEEDQQFKISKLLGNCEYIFVDEYQDVAEHEYHLVKLIAGLQKSEDRYRSVQTNICVIGDDDQNIYEWRGTSTQYIQSFQAEYQAQQFLLVENYRSTEPIIATANRLIQNNKTRLKNRGDQQVKIDNDRVGQGGLEVQSLKFDNENYQAEYIKGQVEKWITRDGIKPGEIAILARNWQHMDKARALLERRVGIPTYSLKGEDTKLIRNRVTQLLITALERNPDLIIPKEESVRVRFENFFKNCERSLSEPTVKTLIKIAEDIDKERGYGYENLSTQIAVSEIITSIYEFNESPDISIDPDAVLVTSCHGAKGLEFKYVILIVNGFDYRQDRIESERRLFYVAMTRAKEKLILTYSQSSQFTQETGATPYHIENTSIAPPQFIFYADLSPYDINLGYIATKENQELIKKLQEGNQLQIKINRYQNSWGIYTSDNTEIGELSRKATNELARKKIELRDFQFQDKEVTVRNVYKHLKLDQITDDILEDWYVIIPQIRVCRD